MTARRLVLLVLLLAAVFSIAVPSSASAADATGCSGEVTSYTADGALLDGASAPGAGGTQDHPFVIDMDGSVSWTGGTDAVIKNGHWSVTVGGVPAQSGDFGNEEGTRTSEGQYALSDLPGFVSMLLGALGKSKIPVTATVTGQGGSCTASGYVTGKGSPFASPLFYSAIFFLLIGILMLIWMLAITG